ncbi:MAG TPA: hypothetical protein PKE26_04870 [Kiritimatiellia bacterium]|nr:hypothetical protein [Kiritimatiellia bacterium]HMO98423.1 hypothetical protein [Kiritimatiellia bacterium]HMP95841.1 hypothetical protein [Kiritimatiellia bacterium]
MKIKSILSITCISVAVLIIQGCATVPRQSSSIVGLDVRHGQVWPGLAEALASNGFKAITLDNAIDSASLEKLGVLFIAAPNSKYRVGELDAIQRFVKNGGGLVCAGQAWSWTYKEYGNQPIETYPLNIIGRRLNFWITEHSSGEPVYFGTEIMAGISVVERSDWWPSEVRANEKSFKPILKDDKHKTVAALQTYGRGRIVLYGHDGILKDNPKLLIHSINFAMGLP